MQKFKGLVTIGLPIVLSGCFINDPPPCSIEDNVAPDAICSDTDSNPFSFKLEYTTANGNRPDGRYGYSSSPGLSKSQAEQECKSVLQHNFNSSQSYLDFELAEIQYYRGNICGDGFHLQAQLGDIHVKRVRKTGPTSYDYDLELTCEAD